jgi:ankyrin repeat protein
MSKEEQIVSSDIHVLIAYKKWEDAESLLNDNPSEAFRTGSVFSSLPLTTALMHDPPLWFVDSLIEANPSAVNSKNEYGMSAIRTAIRGQCSTEVIKRLISEDAEMVKCFGVSGKTCLHLACMYYPNDIDLVKTLLDVWNEAAHWRDRDGWHPLHLACISGSSHEVVKALIDAYPNAAMMPDSAEHQLPLHLAVSHNAGMNVIEELYKAYPDAIKCHAKWDGMLPLHLACCQYNIKPETVRFLIEKYPEGAQGVTKHCSSLPLHFAARYGCSMEIIRMLADAYPQGLNHKNVHNEKPLQCHISQENKLPMHKQNIPAPQQVKDCRRMSYAA